MNALFVVISYSNNNGSPVLVSKAKCAGSIYAYRTVLKRNSTINRREVLSKLFFSAMMHKLSINTKQQQRKFISKVRFSEVTGLLVSTTS